MKNRNLILFAVIVISSFMLIFLAFPANKSSAQKKDDASVFSNAAPIMINAATNVTAPVAALNYPANISVSGMTGTISRVEVSLRGLSHNKLEDLDLLLVSPSGQTFVFLSDASVLPQYQPKDSVYNFADDAATTIPQASQFLPGSYKPTNRPSSGNDTFPAPAPAGPYTNTTFASAFNGTVANGIWSLYIVDDSVNEEAGSIESGWELKLTSGGATQTFANSSYIGVEEAITKAAPYGSTINVSGLSGVITDLKVNLNNFSQPIPSNVDILLVNPNGKSIMLLSDRTSTSLNNVNLSFSTTATQFPSDPITSGTYRPINSDIIRDFMPFPAPLSTYYDQTNSLTGFSRFNPNGDWQLYVVNDANGGAMGTIANGWSLEITTAPVQPTFGGGCAFPSFISVNYPVGANPTNLAVGDFNGDLNRDLVVTNQVSNSISILLGNGLGGFSSPMTVSLPVGSNPYAVAVGSFNADAAQDLAVVNSGSNNVSILLGNGDGTFAAPVSYSTGANPISIDIGDFNNDSVQDLAVANFGGFFSGTISILLGNGSGGFALPTILRTSTQPAYVKSALINGDNNADLIVANFGANTVSVFFGNGANGFTLSQTLSVPNGPVAVEFADVLLNDGIKDLTVAAYNSDTLSVFVGNSGGIFTPFSSTYTVGSNPISVVAADILGNGRNKITAALSGLDKVAVETLSSAGTGFQLFTVGANPNAIIKSDFNNDGKVDLATANSGANNVTVLTNNCSASSGNIYDFNGDRRTDVGIYRPSNGLWAVNGVYDLVIFGRDRDVIAPADFNGDLRSDLAIYRPGSGLWITIDQFTAAYHYINFGLAEDIPMPADYDGDGKADIAVFRPSNGFWYIRRSGDNSFSAISFGMNGDKPVAADYDGDGKADVAVFRPSNATWYIQGSQNGFFAQQFGISSDRTVQGDYDGDGKTDVAVFRDGNWYISRSSDGGFQGQSWGISGDIPVLGDYDGDGKYDLGVVRMNGGSAFWYILKSSDNGIIGFPYGLASDIPIESAYSR